MKKLLKLIFTQKSTVRNSMKKNTKERKILLTPRNHSPVKITKRDNTVINLDKNRIFKAVKKAFLHVYGQEFSRSEGIEAVIYTVSRKILSQVIAIGKVSKVVHIETVQDIAERVLMSSGEHQVAKAYIIYRNQRAIIRINKGKKEHKITSFYSGKKRVKVNRKLVLSLIKRACIGLPDTDVNKILKETLYNVFDGISLKDLYKAMILSARSLTENDPNYSFVAARLLLSNIYREVLDALNIEHDGLVQDISLYYTSCFAKFIDHGVNQDLLSPTLKDFDLCALSKAIRPKRDNYFSYLGIQTLYDRYFIHSMGKRIELPQVFFMRVAMGLAYCEGKNKNKRAIEFYNLLSSFDYMSSTPTLFNSGTCRPQLSSCYLTTVSDSLQSIYKSISDNAMLSKFAGGLGNDWTYVRGIGSYIKGTNGRSSGIIPFLNVVDATAIAVNQGGKRKGAVCVYLESWHIDIEEFLELRKNTGDERRRAHDTNTANWIPDLLIKRVFEEKNWSLFSPEDVPGLHDLHGKDFDLSYEKYERLAEKGVIRRKEIEAKKLWRKMLTMLFETGHPWITFKDPCNIRSPQQHVGNIHSSNLCTEITLNTSENEIAVCNLGSINLKSHIRLGEIDVRKLQKTIKTAIRMLDNVIDINYYSVKEAEVSNIRHRPIGLGIMGFQDVLYMKRIPYCSDAAVFFSDRCVEQVSYFAIKASADLSKERGPYRSYKGSLWSQGVLPIDSIKKLEKSRKYYIDQNKEQTLDWEKLRKLIKRVGMRNSNVLAIAPTATISNICGVTQSIEPTYQNIFVKSNLSGEFTVINSYMVSDLKKSGLWDASMVHDLKYYNGSLKSIKRVPDKLKDLYLTAFEIEPKWLVEAASRRQKWLDQAHSLNLYMAEPSGRKLNMLYKTAWIKGLKTTYYLRTLGATNSEKSTITDNSLNAVNSYQTINIHDCEACQ